MRSIKFVKQTVVSIAAMLAVVASVGVAAMPAGAKSGGMPKPQVVMQCYHPGFAHFGFHSLQECLQYVAQHTKQHGHGYGYGGKGHEHGNGGNVSIGTIFSNLGTISGGAVSVTVNFITNMFK